MLWSTVKLILAIIVCPFDCTAVARSGKVGPVNQVDHTSWVAVVTPTDRPKSVRNRCVIELFCCVVCVVTLPFWHFCWCWDFCHRIQSDLCPFLVVMSIILVLPRSSKSCDCVTFRVLSNFLLYSPHCHMILSKQKCCLWSTSVWTESQNLISVLHLRQDIF